jgi:hypothetical protein
MKIKFANRKSHKSPLDSKHGYGWKGHKPGAGNKTSKHRS